MTEQELIKEISDRLTLLDSLMKSPWDKWYSTTTARKVEQAAELMKTVLGEVK